jgi:putative ABC transport system ATP-binding protein
MRAPQIVPVNLVSLSSVRKAVPGGRVLFDALELNVNRGEFVAIMGESGVGKSTLLNIIAGLDSADEGAVIIDGTQLAALDEDARTRLRRDVIGFVFQAFHVLPHLTLAQNVALPLLLQHVDTGEAMNRAREMLLSVGLQGREGDYPAVLSGGEMQRVAIARALVHRPSLILADEPTGNLDPDTAMHILDLFSARVRELGAATILVTHSNVAASVADRTLHLTPNGLLERHARPIPAH